MLALGLTLEQALAGTMMRTGSSSEGRDIGVVFNRPLAEGPCVLPACGGVGTRSQRAFRHQLPVDIGNLGRRANSRDLRAHLLICRWFRARIGPVRAYSRIGSI